MTRETCERKKPSCGIAGLVTCFFIRSGPQPGLEQVPRTAQGSSPRALDEGSKLWNALMARQRRHRTAMQRLCAYMPRALTSSQKGQSRYFGGGWLVQSGNFYIG